MEVMYSGAFAKNWFLHYVVLWGWTFMWAGAGELVGCVLYFIRVVTFTGVLYYFVLIQIIV